MTDTTNVVPIERTKRRSFRFRGTIDNAMQDYQARVDEARATLKLLADYVIDPPDGEIDEGIVSGAVDAAVRLLKPIHSLYDPFELELRGKALLEEKING